MKQPIILNLNKLEKYRYRKAIEFVRSIINCMQLSLVLPVKDFHKNISPILHFTTLLRHGFVTDINQCDVLL